VAAKSQLNNIDVVKEELKKKLASGAFDKSEGQAIQIINKACGAE